MNLHCENPKTLLLIEDDERLIETLKAEFTERGYQVLTAARLRDVDDSLKKSGCVDYALVDLRLDGEYGLNAIPIIKAHSPDCRIVMLSGYRSIASAVEAVRRGAVDYLLKPSSLDQIEAALKGTGPAKPPADLKRPSLSDVESEYINFVLARNSGNISQTAKELGLHRQSLQRKLKKYT